MGNSTSNENDGVITEEMLEDYVLLTYLNKTEIRKIFQLFDSVAPGRVKENLRHRFSTQEIDTILPQLRHNPFRDSIYRVFSSENDERLSFEDTLDLCSAFSKNCPADVRAFWAFEIFDFDGDNRLSIDDLIEAVERLTRSNEDGQIGIDRRRAEQVARMILEEMDLTNTGSISSQEFIHLVSRMPDFNHTFHFTI